MANEPALSIIVTSYTIERLDDIKALLNSIKTQTYPYIETVFVVERSKELYEAMREMVHDMPTLKVISQNGKSGLSAARNSGIKNASGDIIAFIDDDAVLSPQWAEETVKAYTADDAIIGLTGPILPLWEEPGMDWFPREFYWVFSCTYYDWTEPREVRNGYGTNISFRKEAFNYWVFTDTFGRTRGFHQVSKCGPVGDETEFSLNLKKKTGKTIIYNPRVTVWHRVYKYRISTPFIAKRVYWEGYTKAMLKKLYSQGEKVLAVEYSLLKRIMTKLFPRIIKGFLTHPITAWNELYVSTIILSSLSIGYFSCLLGKTPQIMAMPEEQTQMLLKENRNE
jgi:glycosyltransferase involved in cell wall biosynthesis